MHVFSHFLFIDNDKGVGLLGSLEKVICLEFENVFFFSGARHTAKGQEKKN